ncbi:hypothetical protein F4810DRAFT_715855 [Camillea tinctor]|nr:hypothetical protein F4810DRAFT_715855 [Camillea tinctor]
MSRYNTLTLALTRHRLAPHLHHAPRRLSTSASDAIAELMRTADPTFTRRQVLDGNQLQKLSLALLRPQLHRGLVVTGRAPAPGTLLPPGYHLAYFTPAGLEHELGPDGTDRTFNPPPPFTRRVWAGGKMSWHGELRVGEEIEERTRLVSATPKMGRGEGGQGEQEMVLVEVEKEFWGEKGLALVDQRSWIFRKEAEVDSKVFDKRLVDTVIEGPSVVKDVIFYHKEGYPTRQLRWSPVGLFRFSALTFNGHRIHYDPSWSTTVEGHQGCVVHGPLNLICMLDYWRDVCSNRPLKQIIYRALAPIYAGDTYQIRASPPVAVDLGWQWQIYVEKDKKICMRGAIIGL